MVNYDRLQSGTTECGTDLHSLSKIISSPLLLENRLFSQRNKFQNSKKLD
jgi:hypothetical protein